MRKEDYAHQDTDINSFLQPRHFKGGFITTGLQFNGTSDHLTVPYDSSFRKETNFTVVSVFEADPADMTGGGMLFAVGTNHWFGNSDYNYHTYIGGGDFGGAAFGYDTTATSNDYIAGSNAIDLRTGSRMLHYGGRGSGNLRFAGSTGTGTGSPDYTPRTSPAISGTPSASFESIRIGCHVGHPTDDSMAYERIFFKGTMYSVSVWNKVLSNSEINGLFSTNPTGGEADLIEAWNFEGQNSKQTKVVGVKAGHIATLNGGTWV